MFTITPQDMNDIANNYGTTTANAIREVAGFLATLEKQRPDLYQQGTLDPNWIQELQHKPEQKPDTPKPATNFLDDIRRIKNLALKLEQQMAEA